METYFISGHLDLTEDEFYEHYAPQLHSVMDYDRNAKFVVGDARGTDLLSQSYLRRIFNIKLERVTVYHMFESPRNNPCNFPTKGGYLTDCERDTAMTLNSTKDILWIREGREGSGTAQNKFRREQVKGLTLSKDGSSRLEIGFNNP